VDSYWLIGDRPSAWKQILANLRQRRESADAVEKYERVAQESGLESAFAMIVDSDREVWKAGKAPWVAAILLLQRYAMLGLTAQALELLREMAGHRVGCIFWVIVDPRTESLRSLPEYHTIIEKLNIRV
jgi:hypothetical protein